MALIDDVKQALRQAFPEATLKLARFSPDRVGGSVIWEGFDGEAQIDRQSRLRDAISTLPAEQQVKVSFILTLTPDEQAALTAD